MNYSRITPEAGMVMKRPPVMISLSGKVPGRAADSSRTRVGEGGGLGRLLGNMIGCLGFLHRGRIYRRRGDARRWATCPGGTPARPGGARPDGVWSPWGSPPGVLRVTSLFHIENNSCKLSARSEKLSRTTFLKKKTAENRNWHWASC